MFHFSSQDQKRRVFASIAATCISLACGTNYGYSAWSPQFAQKLRLSALESNLIGLFGNLGMYSLGFVVGWFVDTRGPRPAVLIGAAFMLLGYFPIHQAYDAGSGSIPLLCAFSYLSGVGGCTSFAAAVKTSALNWPHNRGTATAFPLAAFGLSAFFFSLLGSIFFPGDASDFLNLLAWGTSGMTFVAFFFLKVYPEGGSSYEAISTTDLGAANPRTSISLDPPPDEGHKIHHGPARRPDGTLEPGTFSHLDSSPTSTDPSSSPTSMPQPFPACSPNSDPLSSSLPDVQHALTDSIPPSEPIPSHPVMPCGKLVAAADNVQVFPIANENTPLLLSAASSIHKLDISSSPSEPLHRQRTLSHSHSLERGTSAGIDKIPSHSIDIRGFTLLSNRGFWQLWSIMAILAGIGLMTINNIGNDAKALWKKFDPSKDDAFLVNRQQLHVSILSVLSFTGRLLSGVGSDFLISRLNASRTWCLVMSSMLFTLAQVLALIITNPNYLVLVSALSGLAYGSLFGVFPSIIAETFGIKGLSQNWGFITMAPVISSNVFNIFYGKTYDAHSEITESGERICYEGLKCYQSAYGLTLLSGFAGILVALWTIRWQNLEKLKNNRNLKIDED